MSSTLLPNSVRQVIDHFARLPGIGQKTAERLTFYLLKDKKFALQHFGQALLDFRAGVRFCEKCHNLTEQLECAICANAKRDQSTICVLEEVLDLVALEKTAEYQGVYHVLHGVISPINGISPQDLMIEQLLERVARGGIHEVILATNPTMEGEATALFIAKKLQPLNVKITRLARGLASGSDIEYADKMTLSNSLAGRREI